MWTIGYKGHYIHGHFDRKACQAQVMAPAGSPVPWTLIDCASRDAAERRIRKIVRARS